VVKAFYIFANLTSEAYADQLVAKDNVKKVSAQAFLQAKGQGDTDKKAEAKMNSDSIVINAKADLISKIRKWEEYKGHKETTILKKDMLKSIGFDRKQDLNVTGDS
jgi:superfamily I DNA and RNA helicase